MLYRRFCRLSSVYRNVRCDIASRFASGPSVQAEYVFQLKEVAKLLQSGRSLFSNVNLAFIKGSKVGVIGINGSGKSSLMKIIAGIDKDFDGDVWVKSNISMKYLYQEPELDKSLNVLDNVKLGLQEHMSCLNEFEAVSEAMATETDDNKMEELLNKQATLQQRIDDLDAWSIDHKIRSCMRALNLPPAESSTNFLSGGERRRIALCQILLNRPDVLLLDEPTNHLDPDSVNWLEDYLKNFKGNIICVTHDRYFLDNVADWILELDGKGNMIPYQGNYSAWLKHKAKAAAAASEKDRPGEESEMAQQAKFLQQELDWMTKVKTGKGTGGTDIVVSGGRAKSVINTTGASGKIQIPPPPRLGDTVVNVSNLFLKIDPTLDNANNNDKRIEQSPSSPAKKMKVLFNDLTFSLKPSSITGIIGLNGSGKTTLFRVITGEVKPDAGKVVVGPTVKLGVVSQMRDDLSAKRTVWQEIVGEGSNEEMQVRGPGGVMQTIHVRSYLNTFNIKGNMVDKPVGMLSGGERNRVHLAKILKGGFNTLFLDEPTNDLDVETLRSLEIALKEFAFGSKTATAGSSRLELDPTKEKRDGGSVTIISHDRMFLDRLCDQIIAFEGDGKIRVFNGNFSDYRKLYGTPDHLKDSH